MTTLRTPPRPNTRPPRRRRSCRRRARGGFGLIVVLLVLALLGGAIAMMAAQSGAIAHQTRRMRDDARRTNLQASAWAWAAANRPMPGPNGEDPPTTVNTSALGIEGAQVIVHAIQRDAGGPYAMADCQLESAGRTIRWTARLPLGPATRPRERDPTSRIPNRE